MGVRDIHLPAGGSSTPGGCWSLWCRAGGGRSAMRFTVAGSSCCRICGQEPTFAMDSDWRDRPAYMSCPRCRSGVLGDDEYVYHALSNAPQHVTWPPPPTQEEDAEEEEIPLYMPPGLSEVDDIQLAYRGASSSSLASGRGSACSCTP
jgi:hypothetical protein